MLDNNKHSMEHVHEYIKLRQVIFEEKDLAKFENLAITALKEDP